MPDFNNMLAQMYVNARPQFNAQSPRPGVLPSTGSHKEGYGQIGENFGKGFSESIQEGFVKPRVEAAANRTRMDIDPITQYSMMQSAYNIYGKLPPEMREQVRKQPGHQAQLQKWLTMFPGVAPIVSDPQSGMNSFAPPAAPIEQQKAESLESMEPGGRNRLLFSNEALQQIHGRGILEGQIPAQQAEAGYHQVQTGLAPRRMQVDEMNAETNRLQAEGTNRYHDRMADVAQQNADTKAGIDPWAARFAIEDKRADRAEKEGKRKSFEDRMAELNKTLTGAYATYAKSIRDRHMAYTTGKAVGSGEVIKDTSDLILYLDSTADLDRRYAQEIAAYEGVDPRVVPPRVLPQQINLATSQLSALASAYQKELTGGKDYKELYALKSAAYDLYSRFAYGRQNVLDSKRTKELMQVFEQKPSMGSLWSDKRYTIPEDAGLLDKAMIYITGRY